MGESLTQRRRVGDTGRKCPLIPHTLARFDTGEERRESRREGSAAHQLDGGVTAHRGDDGSLV